MWPLSCGGVALHVRQRLPGGPVGVHLRRAGGVLLPARRQDLHSRVHGCVRLQRGRSVHGPPLCPGLLSKRRGLSDRLRVRGWWLWPQGVHHGCRLQRLLRDWGVLFHARYLLRGCLVIRSHRARIGHPDHLVHGAALIVAGGSGQNAGAGGTGGAPSTQGSTSIRTLGTNQCRGDADCSDIHDTCVQPGGVGPCGLCLVVASPCTSDSDCQADPSVFICDVPVGCFCPPGAKTCIPGCTDASGCNAGEACTAHRCVPASCQSDADCPTDFGCAGGGCGRKGCTTDADCSGYCVTGACYSTPGTCYGAVL